MPVNWPNFIAALDAEISRLHAARKLLAGGTPTPKRKPRVLSPEARAKIAAAQRKRWAQQKKAGKQ